MSGPASPTRGAVLRLSTSRRQPIFALRLQDGSAVHTLATAGPQRGTDLPARVAELLAAHHLTAHGLDVVALDVGPGSYTGLRVAVTFARFVAAFTDATLEAFTSLELLAAGAWRNGTVDPNIERLQVVLDARRGRVHTGIIAQTGGSLRIMDGPRATGLAEFSATEPLLIEPALESALADRTAGHPVHLVTEPEPEWLFEPRLTPRSTDEHVVEPLYLMGTYADD